MLIFIRHRQYAPAIWPRHRYTCRIGRMLRNRTQWARRESQRKKKVNGSLGDERLCTGRFGLLLLAFAGTAEVRKRSAIQALPPPRSISTQSVMRFKTTKRVPGSAAPRIRPRSEGVARILARRFTSANSSFFVEFVEGIDCGGCLEASSGGGATGGGEELRTVFVWTDPSGAF